MLVLLFVLALLLLYPLKFPLLEKISSEGKYSTCITHKFPLQRAARTARRAHYGATVTFSCSGAVRPSLYLAQTYRHWPCHCSCSCLPTPLRWLACSLPCVSYHTCFSPSQPAHSSNAGIAKRS